VKKLKRGAFFNLILSVLLVALVAAGVSSCRKPEPLTFKYVTLPVLENLPIFVGIDQGLFQKYGLTIELVAVQSALERDTLIRGGQADCTTLDLIAIGLFNRDAITVKGVRLVNDTTKGKFALVVGPGCTAQSVADLAGVPVGVAFNTVAEYVGDTMLRLSGVPADKVNLAEWRQINVRLEALINDQLPAGIFPEPFATYATQNGCRILARDSEFGGLGHDILTFTAAALAEHPDRVRDFMAAYEKAVELVRKDPDRWSSLIQDKGLVPPMIGAQATVPTFAEPSLPTVEQVTPIMQWAVDKGILPVVPAIENLVTADFLAGN